MDEVQKNRILYYAPGSSAIFFTTVWIIMTVYLLYILLITEKGTTLDRYIYMFCIAYCVVNAGRTFFRFRGPFLEFTEDEIIIHHSLLNKRRIRESDIRNISYLNEEAFITTKKGMKEIVNLKNLSPEDKDQFMDHMEGILLRR